MVINLFSLLFPIWIAKAEKKNIENESLWKCSFPRYIKYVKNIYNQKIKNPS